MVKLQIGPSTFVCETPEEAVRIHRLISPGGIAPMQAGAAPTHKAATPVRNSGRGMDVIKKLGPFVGKELSSEELAKIVGAKGANGLGPKIHQLRRSLESNSIMLDDYLEKRKLDATSPTTWVIKAAS